MVHGRGLNLAFEFSLVLFYFCRLSLSKSYFIALDLFPSRLLHDKVMIRTITTTCTMVRLSITMAIDDIDDDETTAAAAAAAAMT